MLIKPVEKPLIPRLLASNALHANQTYDPEPDGRLQSSASSLVITITLTQYDKLHLAATL